MHDVVEDQKRARLKTLRKEQQMTQADFAAKLGMPFRTYQAIESGARPVSMELVEGLLRHFNIDPAWFILGEGEPLRRQDELSVVVLKELLERWDKYPVNLTNAEKVDDFARVLEHAKSLGLRSEVFDLAVRRVS